LSWSIRRNSAIAVMFVAVLSSTADSKPTQDVATKDEAPPPSPAKLGVSINGTRAFPSYNLINASGKKTYLLGVQRQVDHVRQKARGNPTTTTQAAAK
jgi:hypothetical protein